MSRNRHKSKKSPAEAREYRNNLGENEGGLTGTSYEQSMYLYGSDEIDLDNRDQVMKNDERVARKPISLMIMDWLRGNIISVVLVPGIIAMISWLIVTAIGIKEDMAVCEYRLETLEKDLSDIEDDIPNKEVLELQFEVIQDTIKQWDFSEANDRIMKLEEELEDLKEEINEE